MRRMLITVIVLAAALLIAGGRTLARQSGQPASHPCNRTPPKSPRVAVVVLLQQSTHMTGKNGEFKNRMIDARRAVTSLAYALDPQHDLLGLITYNQVISEVLPLATVDGNCVWNVVGEDVDANAGR